MFRVQPKAKACLCLACTALLFSAITMAPPSGPFPDVAQRPGHLLRPGASSADIPMKWSTRKGEPPHQPETHAEFEPFYIPAARYAYRAGFAVAPPTGSIVVSGFAPTIEGVRPGVT
jgi:hypothetical protein